MAVLVNIVSQLRRVVVGQVCYTDVGVDAGGGADVGRGLAANPVDIGKSNLDSLVSGQVNAGNTSHTYTSMVLPAPLALALLVLGVVTDDHDLALALDNLALFTHVFDR